MQIIQPLNLVVVSDSVWNGDSNHVDVASACFGTMGRLLLRGGNSITKGIVIALKIWINEAFNSLGKLLKFTIDIFVKAVKLNRGIGLQKNTRHWLIYT